MKMNILAVFAFLASLLPTLIDAVGFEMFRWHKGVGRVASHGKDATWCYEDPNCNQDSATSDWNTKKACAEGKRQSPIDVPAAGLTVDQEKGCPVDFGLTMANGYDIEEYTVCNVGNTIMVTSHSAEWPNAHFRWPAQNSGTYSMAQFHFHWGPDDNSGSEHQIDGKSYAMEMHLVHWRSGGPDSFKTANDALASEQGNALAVISVMLLVDDVAGTVGFLEPLVKSGGSLDNIPYKGNDTHVVGIPIKLSELLKKQTQIYHYEGSLTTPGCNEIVQWLVCMEPVRIKRSVVERFRNMTEQQTTFRKIQPIYDRKTTAQALFH